MLLPDIRPVRTLLSITFALALLSATAVHATTITVNNLDGGGEGFNDTTRALAGRRQPGHDARGAAPERVQRGGEPLGGTRQQRGDDPGGRSDGSAHALRRRRCALGFAGPTSVFRDFTGAPVAGTWFGQAEANALHGSDLDVGNSDIDATFNSDIDNGCLPGVTGMVLRLRQQPARRQDRLDADAAPRDRARPRLSLSSISPPERSSRLRRHL